MSSGPDGNAGISSYSIDYVALPRNGFNRHHLRIAVEAKLVEGLIEIDGHYLVPETVIPEIQVAIDQMMVTVNQAAAILGAEKDMIFAAVRRGCIDGAVQGKGRKWRLPLPAVKEYVNRDAARQRAVLEYVSTHRAATVRQVAAKIDMKPSTTFALLSKMIAAGSLRRDEHGALVATVPYLAI